MESTQLLDILTLSFLPGPLLFFLRFVAFSSNKVTLWMTPFYKRKLHMGLVLNGYSIVSHRTTRMKDKYFSALIILSGCSNNLQLIVPKSPPPHGTGSIR
jgi:hypothetical protein